ncbi:MAG: response regulator [Elusimicrobia bacterium]|nr:response regulator [Elusimicrobiota bacterium]
MAAPRKSVQLIIAEDDEDDYFLTKSAFEKAGLRNELVWVKNGEELLETLKRSPAKDGAASPSGARLVILDLNMPRMDGREALARIKADPELRRIPIIVMTTSSAEEDVIRSYDLGACSFIHKPVTFADFVSAANLLRCYWLEMVELPGGGGATWTKT